MRPLRVTHVVATEEFAGTERYVVDVAGELARRGHDVTVVGGADPVMRRALDGAVRWRPGGTTREAATALARGGRRDLVHSHMTRADFVVLATSPLHRATRVSTRHITHPRGWSPAARRVAPVVRRALARELAVSTWTSERLERPADAVLLNGVAVVPAPTAPREPWVVVAQRLAAEKDTATALRAFAASGIAADGWRLVVAGRGPEAPRLRALADELGVGSAVDLPGWIDDPGEIYRRASVLLAPAPGEPCGLTVIEAMAHALPVVAAGSGGHLETVGAVPGAALFPPGDVETAAAHLRRLAGDPGLRRDYGGRLWADQRTRLTLAGHVDALETVYAEVTAPVRSATRAGRRA